MTNTLSFDNFYFNIPLDANCTVCLEPTKANVTGNVVAHPDPKTNKYLHFFHIKCIKPWVETHKTCPNCQVTIDRSSLDSFSDQFSAFSEKAWSFIKPHLSEWGKKVALPIGLYLPVGLKILEDSQVIGPVFGIDPIYRFTTFLAGASAAYSLAKNLINNAAPSIENKAVLLAGITSLAAVFAFDPTLEGSEGLRTLVVSLVGGHLAGIGATLLHKHEEPIKHFLAPLLANPPTPLPSTESTIF